MCRNIKRFIDHFSAINLVRASEAFEICDPLDHTSHLQNILFESKPALCTATAMMADTIDPQYIARQQQRSAVYLPDTLKKWLHCETS